MRDEPIRRERRCVSDNSNYAGNDSRFQFFTACVESEKLIGGDQRHQPRPHRGQSIVILDFGAQYSQLIARRIREQNVFSVVLPCTRLARRNSKATRPSASCFGRALVGLRHGRAARRHARVFELGVPVLGICYGLAVHGAHAGRQSASRGQARVRPRGGRRLSIRLAAVQGTGPKLAGLDVARRRGAGTASRLRADGEDRTTPSPAFRTRPRDGTRCSSIPKCTTRRRARRSCAISSSRSAAPSRPGRRSTSSTRPSSSVTQTSRQRTRHLRALRRRGFVGRGGAGRSRLARCQRRVAADLRLREQRRAAQERIRKSAEEPARQARAATSIAVDATERFLSKLAGVTDPEKKRKIIGNEFIEVFDEEAHRIEQERRQGRVAGAGHALSRRDRVALACAARRRSSSRITTSAACPRR